MAEQRPIPAPKLTLESEPVFAAAREGKLMIGHCKDCDKVHWYPRYLCPYCHSKNTDLKQASGNGEIYSYTVFRRGKIPYSLAYVTLDEGTTMLTNIVDCDLDSLKIGQKVKVKFVPTEGEDTPPMPMFTPA